MSLRRRHPGTVDPVYGGAHEHVAEPPAAASRELPAAREREDDRRRVRHSGRFRWMTAALFLVALAALGAAVALSGSGHRSSAAGTSWSSWQPSDGGLAGAQEIADYVAPYYRATPSSQLAVVTVVNLNNPNNPLQVVVPASGSTGSLLPLPASSTIVYNLCGVGGRDCSIGVGQPSAARLLLLRREALELALYTFKYISGTQIVVAILPPGHTTIAGCTGICAKPQSKPVLKRLDLAVAFERNELNAYLSQPLRSTLPEELPPTVAQMSTAAEAPLVSVITAHGLFDETTQQGQDGSTVITLSPQPPQ